MANDIGIRIGVDGEKEFKTALSAINAQLKNLSSEMKATVTSMTGGHCREPFGKESGYPRPFHRSDQAEDRYDPRRL